MNIKQVIIVIVSRAKGSHRLVYDAACKLLSGDETKAFVALHSDEHAQVTVVVRGQRGESMRLIIDRQGTVLGGDKEAVAAVLSDFLEAMTYRIKEQVVEASARGLIPIEVRDELLKSLPPDETAESQAEAVEEPPEELPS